MARTARRIPAGTAIADRLALAQLHRCFPVEVVRETLSESNRSTVRTRELPNEFVAYLPILLCMYRAFSQKEVLRVMTDGLHNVHGLEEFKITGRSGISQARARVGSEPLVKLFERCAKPLAKLGSMGCFYQGLRLVAVDGTVLDVEECAENARFFGHTTNQKGESGSPRARMVGLVELGTRACFGMALGPCKQSEHTLVHKLVPQLTSGMLCLADRLYASFEISKAIAGSGADFLIRIPTNRILEKEETLPDGSYISTMYSSTKDKERKSGLKVRVIDFDAVVTVDKIATRHTYRLITTLMNYKRYPFNDLAHLYRERWEVETMLDEVKTHLMGSQPLRSKAPDLVIQEAYGMMLAHYAVRAVMYEAAAFQDIDPDRLSFEHSKNVMERVIPKIGIFSPSAAKGVDSRRDS